MLGGWEEEQVAVPVSRWVWGGNRCGVRLWVGEVSLSSSGPG